VRINLSSFLAQLWGITFILVSLVLLIKPKLLQKLFIEVENKTIMVFLGIVTFVIGLVMVFVHNLWVLDWRVVITIIGWLTLIKGLDLLLLPKRMKKRWSKMKNWQWFMLFASLFLAGLAFSYLGLTV